MNDAQPSDAARDAQRPDASSGGTCGEDEACDDGSACTTDRCVDSVCVHTSTGTCDWPAETSGEARNLTDIEGPVFSNDFHRDLSGAVWNPHSRMLWLCRNNGPSKLWAVVEDGAGGFRIDERGGRRGEWEEFGDAEAVAQADFTDTHTVYVMQESGGIIEEYDLSTYGTKVLQNRWILTTQLGGSGAEGMTFVPDEFLSAQGFVDAGGAPYTSTQGMDGLMFVGHQSGGFIYVFDLNRDTGAHVFVGRFDTGAGETAGLEMDRSTGQLFIWHDDDFDQLEVTRLSSTEGAGGRRKLDTLVTYGGPAPILFMSTNHEGIAVMPVSECVDGRRRFFMTTDGARTWSLLMYERFPC